MSNDWQQQPPHHHAPPPAGSRPPGMGGPPPQNNWDTDFDPNVKPEAVLWYQLYAGALALLYLLVVVGGIVLLAGAAESSGSAQGELLVQGVIYVGMGVVLGIASAASIFFPRAKWAHVTHIILLAMGATSCCCLPICIPILMRYNKPDVKRWFNIEDYSTNSIANKFS